MNFVKSMKVNYSLSALLCVILGVVLLVWPSASIQIACIALGMVLGGYGIVQIVLYLVTKEKTMISHSMMVLGIVLAVIGIYIVLRPETILKAIPIIVGIMIVIHGLHNAVQALDLRKMTYENWWVALLLAILTIAFGVLLVCNPFEAIDVAVRLVGICLLYDGLSDMWILSRVFKTRRNQTRVIDTEAVVVEEEEP